MDSILRMSNLTIEIIESTREKLRKEGIDPEQYFPVCLGCGYCCLQATCSLGVELFGVKYPCPALIWDSTKYRCKLAEDFKDELYIGSGCCSPMNDWRKEVKKRNETIL